MMKDPTLLEMSMERAVRDNVDVRHEEVISPGHGRAVGARIIYRVQNYVSGGLYREGLLQLKTDLEELLAEIKQGLGE